MPEQQKATKDGFVHVDGDTYMVVRKGHRLPPGVKASDVQPAGDDGTGCLVPKPKGRTAKR